MARTRLLTPTLPLLAGVLLGLGGIIFLFAFTRGVGAAEPFASTEAASTPQEALASFIQAAGNTFAGPCDQTVSPRDIGKHCSRLIDERGETQAYLTGRTFSEFSTWVFVQRSDAGWTVTASAPLDFHDLSMTIPWPW